MRKGTLWGVPRLATHGWVLALALIVLGLAPLELRHPITVADASATVDGLRVPLVTSIDQATVDASAQQPADLPPLTAYEAKSGDTVASVAARAGITVGTLTQINQLASESLAAGQRLLVPPVDGTLIPIDPNQSLELLAQTFRVDPDVLRKLNDLAPDGKLPNELFIPAVTTDAIAPAANGADASNGRERVVRFIWPTQGIITQPFWQFHPGIDIANATGTPEVAADGGKVIWAGWGDYGIYVQIDHGNGFQTVYAHMSKVLVSKGQVVAKGQLLGLMGATGRATGPHLHFEIRYQGVPQNPLDLLP